MRLLSETKALERLRDLQTAFQRQIADGYEHRAKDCLTCETQGACCLDAHFVNVHISRLEAVSIQKALDDLPVAKQDAVAKRIDAAIEKYALTSDGDTYARRFACPLFEKGTGCLVHQTGKPVPCMAHACYESPADLPPDELQFAAEQAIDRLNEQTYGKMQTVDPLPIALRKGALGPNAPTCL